MEDQEQVSDQVQGKRPVDRSPSFPYIGLTKAVERLEGLHAFAKRHDARIIDAAKPAWGLGAKSSGTQQTVAALLAFGLIESSGSGESRKVKISELGYRIVADPRPGAKEQALAIAALKPKLVAEFWEEWGAERPNDAIAAGTLHIDRGFTPDGAKAFLRVYDDTISYTKRSGADKLPDSEGEARVEEEPSGPQLAVGDWVQVDANGQTIFQKTRIRAIQDPWVFVEASKSGARISDVTLVERAAPVVEAPPVLEFAREELKAAPGEGMDRFTVDEGVVTIAFPADMSADSVGELEQFFQLFIKKAKRRAGASPKVD